MSQSEFDAKHVTGAKRGKMHAGTEQGMAGFSFAFLVEKLWREFCQPITERSKAKAKLTRKYFRHSCNWKPPYVFGMIPC